MSESRDSSSGLNGKGENTKMKSDSTQGEEETKCGSEKIHGEENIDRCKLQLPIKKRFHSRTMQDHDWTSNIDVISESKPRQYSSSLINIPEGAKKKRTPRGAKLLFKKKLSVSDASTDWLVIPKDHAAAYFPTLGLGLGSSSSSSEEVICKKHKLKFVEELGNKWEMEFAYYKSSKSCTLRNGWKGFVQRHQLRKNDVVCFHKLIENHYYFLTCEKPKAQSTDHGHRQRRRGSGSGSGSGSGNRNGNGKGKETISGRNERGSGSNCNKDQSNKPAPVETNMLSLNYAHPIVPKAKRTTVHQGLPNNS